MIQSTQTTTVRVRFAPSPTGFLHIGGARTALFNWLYARATGGKFLLRIEDTDLERSKDEYTADIKASLQWLGLNWDEEPVFQSKRFDRYQAIAKDLVEKKLAYRCECTPEELDAVRAQCEREKRPFRYPGTCRDKTNFTKPTVVRMHVPNDGETGFTDLIRGEISVQNKDIDDWVIQRTDGSPTYNFCVVVDDHDLNISHVLRGDDHINNTPKQVHLYKTLGFAVPFFAHLPMILGADKTKLSKRHGAASTLEYRKMGYLPEALLNFLVRLGWSFGDQEVFTVEEMCKNFSLEHIGKSNAIFNTDKLNWLSGKYLAESKPNYLREYLQKYFSTELSFMGGVDDARFEKGIAIIQGKVKTLLELIDQLKCLFGDDPSYDVSHFKPEEKQKMAEILEKTIPVLQTGNFVATELESGTKNLATSMALKLSPFAQALRYAVTGGKVSPALFDMLELQGQPAVKRRVQSAISALKG